MPLDVCDPAQLFFSNWWKDAVEDCRSSVGCFEQSWDEGATDCTHVMCDWELIVSRIGTLGVAVFGEGKLSWIAITYRTTEHPSGIAMHL